MSEPQRPRRETSDFSIARILSKDFSVAGSKCHTKSSNQSSAKCHATYIEVKRVEWPHSLCPLKRDVENPEVRCPSAERSRVLDVGSAKELSWLRCTRYRPPKLPRRTCSGKSTKRRPGSQPRIPFTKFQLQVLEDKYKSNAYLSRRDVVHLSSLLHLPQSRVKIWFQNRRARERRETQSLEQSSPMTT